ncbi:FlxA-like family protein [Serratia sp. NPDC078593]|uniref:FlxA-like family protein n=1 Tax=unclassified Serratia (in: enterobacteria) TaxID=2647522 RepID=UPI0037D4B0C1
MSNIITMLVPPKHSLPAVGNVFSAPGKESPLLMAAPVNTNPEAEKASGSDNDKPVAPKNNSAAARIEALQQQIQNLQKKLVELQNSGDDVEQINQQKQLIQAQIKLLQAEIARIQKEEMQKQQQEHMAQTTQGRSPNGDGINRPTPLNALDVYI